MKILHLNASKKWVPVEKQIYDNEAQLQNLLIDDVNTLPLDEIGYDTKFVTIGKEVSLQNGALDILAVSPQGHIALIETKLDKNSEVKRTVVGQVLGYAAYLWNKSYADLETIFRKFVTQQNVNFSGNLIDYVKEKSGDDSISESEFKEGLEKRLRLGSFTLLIVVDQVNQELRDIANYLNDRTGQEIDFYVIEMELVGDKQEQFLIPRLANPPRKNVTFSSEKSKSNNGYDRTPITKEDFINKLSDSGKKLATSFINKFENNHLVVLTWRKNGFSIMSKFTKDIDAGGYTSFPYFFFQAPMAEGSFEGLSFGYPEEIYTKSPETRNFTGKYVTYYRSLPGYDKKHKTIKNLTVFTDGKIKEFTDLIEKTAKALNNTTEG
jgi:hypothetical protein